MAEPETRDEELCPHCGAPRRVSADGLCPNCLLRIALEPSQDSSQGPSSGEGAEPGTPQSAAPPPGDDRSTLEENSSQVAGRIGPYKVLQLLGQGGMGEVYLAEQVEPILRRVALKVIKAGMDTRRVIARFESERQALALMNHPSIARVFDAGATPRGLPYFAMEFVAGPPITEYCD